MKIAMLDDDSQIVNLVQRIVQAQGWQFQGFSTFATFAEAVQFGRFDLLVIDWLMPDVSGIDVVASIRSEWKLLCPIMMVSCRQDDHDVAFALQKGISDYMVKPLRPAEFLARVKLLISREQRATSLQEHSWAPFEFDAAFRRISLQGRELQVSPMEYELATFLFAHQNMRLARDQILIAVFGKTGKEVTRTLDTHVYRLKKKLSLDGRFGFKLTGVYGYGYMLQGGGLNPKTEAGVNPSVETSE